MDSLKRSLFGSSKKDKAPVAEPAPIVAQPVQSAPPTYSAANTYPSYPAHPVHPAAAQPYPHAHGVPHGAPYPGPMPVPGARHAPTPPYGAQQQPAPYPGQAHPSYHPGQAHHAPYPGQPPAHQQQPQPAPRRRQSSNPQNPPDMPAALTGKRTSNAGLERVKSLTGCLMEQIPMDLARKYQATTQSVSLPIGFRPMEPPDLNALTYDFQLEERILH